ncbi:helix-turn-helix transcriptional regulator [Enterobacter asburiae]
MTGNIYLITDDNFFSYGLSVFMEANGEFVEVLTWDMSQDTAETHIKCGRDDVVIIAINNLLKNRQITKTVRQAGVRPFFLFDIPFVSGNSWQYGYYSKRSGIEQLLSVIKNYMNEKTDYHSLLTHSELQVLTRLAEGKSPERVSREIYMPVKMVYSRKSTAIKNVGMHSLNSLSILLAERLLFKTVRFCG